MMERVWKELRARAERELTARPRSNRETAALEELVQELEVLQVELELQNEDLRATHLHLDAALARYRELFEHAPVGYLILDEEHRIRDANRRATKLLRVPLEELVGAPFSRYLDEASADHLRALRPSPESRTFAFEVRLRGGDGSQRPAWVELVATCDGERPGLRVAISDLSALQATEKQLADREAQLQALLDGASDGALVIDVEGRIESVNRAATALLGHGPRELAGRNVREVFSDVGWLEHDAKKAMVAVARDGAELCVSLSTTTFDTSKGPRTLIMVRDVTDEKARELELHESLARFRSITEQIEDGFYVAEVSSGRTLYASPAFDRIFGTRPETHAWLTAVHPEDRAHVEECFERLLAGDPLDEEHRVVGPGGHERVVRHRAFQLDGADRVTGIFTDVTDERVLEAELRQAQKLETLGALASGIAHDFNNLLMGITGCAEMALADLDNNHPARVHVKRGMDAALRGASVTRQLLAFGRKRPVERRAIEVDAVALGSRELLFSMVGSNVELVIEAGAPGARVLSDTGDLEQILMNLATNARDAMPNGGKLSIRTALRVSGDTDRCMVAVEVEDTGSGMDDETRARLFEPFFTTKSATRGTGLGMASVAALVRRLGGTIDVESALGRGTRFTLLLPVASIEVDDEKPSEPPSGHGKVLVVEDDPLVRLTLGHYLHSLGYQALLASSPDEALRVAGDHAAIDAVVTDVLLPGGLGMDVVNRLEVSHPNLPALYVSAHPARELVRKRQVPSGALMLQKPFDRTTLAAALRELLEDRPGFVSPRTVLLVDDSEAALGTLKAFLRSRGYHVLAAASRTQAVALAESCPIDALVTDFALHEATGTELASDLRRSWPALPVILVSGSADVEIPPNGRFLQKPFDLERLDEELRAALKS